MRLSLRQWFAFTVVLLAAVIGLETYAAERQHSTFGEVALPQPAKPVDALACVEPVEIMRRDHMKLLLHQRDATVIDGQRDGKYSLTGCINCHNPADTAEVVRYQDPEHFCADCHTFASVRIDCFECHADRGQAAQPDRVGDQRQPVEAGPPWADNRELSAVTLRPGSLDVD